MQNSFSEEDDNFNNSPEEFFHNPIVGIKPQKLQKNDLKIEIIKAKFGNERSFEKILSHMHNYICYVMSEYFIQGSEAQDVAQECAIKLINIIDKYDESKGSFNYFAQSSIKKHIITKINNEQTQKKKVLNKAYSLNDETKNQDGECVTFLETITESSDNLNVSSCPPLEIIQRDYENYLLESVTKVLSELESSVFYLRYFEHLSYKEIAKKLKLYKIDVGLDRKILDPKAVDNAIWRSRPKIKKVLQREGLDPSIIQKKRKSKKKTSPLKNQAISKPRIKVKQNT